MTSRLSLSVFVLLIFALPTACTKKAGVPDNSARSPLWKKGHAAYQTSCVACHSSDPKKSGALGPEIYGSSLELLKARILRAEYPPGYTPKRPSKAMVALPQSEKDIDALFEYLNH